MADGLYLPDGTFQPFSSAELSTELATRQNAGVCLRGTQNSLGQSAMSAQRSALTDVTACARVN